MFEWLNYCFCETDLGLSSAGIKTLIVLFELCWSCNEKLMN